MWKRFGAAVVLTASVQAPGPSHGATLTRVQRVSEPLPFSSPALKMSGTIRPIPGHRLDLVVITVADMPIEADTRQFTLISTAARPTNRLPPAAGLI